MTMFLAPTADAEGAGALQWHESFTARLEALALLQTLNAELLSHDSATLTLDRWCAAHQLASPARIVAERAGGAEQAPTDEQRRLLGVSGAFKKHRHQGILSFVVFDRRKARACGTLKSNIELLDFNHTS